MPTISPQVTPYYGGGQVVNPANVILINDTPPTQLTEDKVGTIAVNNSQQKAYMLVSKTFGENTWAQIGDAEGFISEILGSDHQIVVNQVGTQATVGLSDGISIGEYQGSGPPVGGILMPGGLVVGSTTPDSRSYCSISANDATGAQTWSLQLTGTKTGDSQGSAISLFDNTVASPTINGGRVVGLDTNIRFYTPTGVTTATAAGVESNPFVDGLQGTLTNAYSFYAPTWVGPIAAGGVITNSYGAWFNNPTIGAGASTALYADDMCIGYAGRTPPTNGAVITGNVGIGTSAPAPSAALTVASTTQGFLPPVMTQDQKNAIASPTPGLVVFDSTLQALSYYTTAGWFNIT